MKPSRKQTATPKRGLATPKFKTPLSKVKDPVEVFCRIRPPPTNVEAVCIRKVNNVTIQLVNPEDIARNGGKEFKGTNYTFSYVFDADSIQKDVFAKVALPLIDDFLHLKNGLLFAYGVTSSGKTFTITGTAENCGVLPRTLDVIFNSISDLQPLKFTFKSDKANGFTIQPPEDAMLDQQKEMQSKSHLLTPKSRRREVIGQEWSQRIPVGTKISSVDPTYRYSVFITFIEIYNNYVYDLLEEDSTDDQKRRMTSKQVREDTKRNMYVAGITEIEARTADEAFEFFQKGQQRRKVGNTVLNMSSSRSHSVFTIKLVRAPVDDTGKEVLLDQSLVNITQLSLVDLAGSERSLRTGNTGSQLKEAGNINNSLMVLRQCLEALREKQQTGVNKFIPFRLTKLTHLFRSYFEEDGKVRVIVCAHPGDGEYDELVHVMKFAEMAQDVMLSAKPIEMTPLIRRKATRLFSISDGETQLVPKIVLPDGCLPNDEGTLIILGRDLKERHAGWTNTIQILNLKLQDLRDTFIDVQEQNNSYAQQLRTLEMDLKGRDHQLMCLERKMSADEMEKEHLQQQFQAMEDKVQKLQHQHHEKDYLAKKYEVEKECIKNNMEDRIKQQRANHQRIMESILAQKQAELEAKMSLNKEKFQMLKDILNAGDTWDPRFFHVQGTPGMQAALSDSHINLAAGDTRGPPTCNPRRARTQSADGGVWVEHKPQYPVDTGTILQPQMKKKKSMNALNAKEFCKQKGAGYVLTHQEQGQEGNLETQLIKGSIIPSSGGGVQVVFNDVETVKQTSPSQKRSAENDGAYELRKHNSDRRPPVLPKKPRK